MALGLNDYPWLTRHDLTAWAHPQGFTTYTDIYPGYPHFFVTRINQLMQIAKEIHFNLEDVQVAFANNNLDPTDPEQPLGSYINYELWLVNNVPDYGAKTIKHNDII